MANANSTDWSRARIDWQTDLVRFFTSAHCRDLLTIALLAPGLAVVVALVGLRWSLSSELIAASCAAAVTAMAWAFQSANLRFGAADIFASEILTLCRISSVIAFVARLVEGYGAEGQPVQSAPSTQDYVIIFHNNSKDLEILDGNVVGWVTEFYVYFKAMVDSSTRLPRHDEKSPISDEAAALYKDALFSVIYMAFLMFESGRQALMRLIDDTEKRQEAVLIALVSEIQAYIFLYQAFSVRKTDIRKQRIEGRLPQYLALLQEIAPIAAAEPGGTPMRRRIRDLAREVADRWREGNLAALDPGPAPAASPAPLPPLAA
jgi:hypothetical protein